MEMDSALGFHALISIGDGDSLFTKILINTVNWLDNNQQGMIFGVLFAAAVLTAVSLWKQRRVEGSIW